MSGEVAVSLPIENGSYTQRPPHSPAISPARDHEQVSNNEVSSEISFVITYYLLYFFESILKRAASIQQCVSTFGKFQCLHLILGGWLTTRQRQKARCLKYTAHSLVIP